MLVLAIIMLLMHPLLFCIKIIKKNKNKNKKKKKKKQKYLHRAMTTAGMQKTIQEHTRRN